MIYYWTDERQHGIYLFYIITKRFFISKYFNITRKSAFAPSSSTLANTKKAIWRNLLSIQNEVISLAAIHSKELWLVQPENHAIVKPGSSSSSSSSSSWNENLQWKQDWAAKSTNFKEIAGKGKSVFVIRAALWAEKLGRCVKYCRSWENILGQLVVTVNLGTIWFEFWMKGVAMTVRGNFSSVVSYSHISLI